MERIPLERAIRFIRADFEANQQPCFFFVVGAGISKPPIPLASEIIDLLRTLITRDSTDDIVEPDDHAPLFQRYSWWFQQAFSTPDATRGFLEKLMLDKPISEASMYLASMVTADNKCPARTVLTTNFDDFISRSLSIAGRRYRVIDTPKLLDRYDRMARIPQIVHLHGVASEYDAINLERDIESRAKETREFISNLINNELLPIMLGYSGWEKDGIVTALRSVLFDADGKAKYLPRRKALYWFCYSARDAETVTSLFNDHPSIYCVVPQSALKQPAATAQIREGTASIPDSGTAEETTLPAAKVLRRLCRAFEIQEPELFADPVQHFIEQFGRLFPTLDKGRLGEARSALSRLLAADLHVSRIEDELASRDLEDAAEILKKFTSGTVVLEESHQKRIIDALANTIQSSSLEASPVEWTKLVELVDVCEKLMPADLKRLRASALIGRGGANCALGEYFKALPDFEEALKRAEGDPEMAPLKASALVNRGYIQSQNNNADSSLRDYEDVIRTFGHMADADVQACVVRARVNKAFRLGELGKQDVSHTRQAIAEYETVATAYSCRTAGKASIFARTPIATAVALALNGAAFQYLLLAKHLWSVRSDDPEIDAALVSGLSKIAQALQRDPENHMMLGNQSYLEFLRATRAGDPLDEALRILRRAIDIGGEEARGFELADASVKTIPPDEQFVQMIHSIPASGSETPRS